MNTDPVQRRDATALYLRCYPHDPWTMHLYDHALRRYAAELGLSQPRPFLDNGYDSHITRPALQTLIYLVHSGQYHTVLVPGPFIFSFDDDEARSIIARLNAFGCQVLELPPLRRRRPSLA